MQINNKEKTPRILIINAIPIGYNNSTGITLKNIFSKWPKNEIMQLTLCNEDTRVSEGNPKYLLFNPRQIIIVYLLKKLFLNKNSSMSNVKDPGVVKKDIISVIKSFFNAFVDDSYILMFPDTIKAIRRFNPDIIYSNLASLRVMKVVLKISKLLQIPIVPHFMDDWPSTIYKAKSTYWAYYKSQRLLTKIIYNMKCGLTISEKMMEVYSLRYKKEFTWLPNPINVKGTHLFCGNKASNSIKIIYCGGLHLKRYISLQKVASWIEGLNNENNKIVLEIYAPENDLLTYEKYFENFSCVSVMSEILPSAVDYVLSTADILVYVECMDKTYFDFIKYSFSTKIPQYMASGRPILAYGPRNIASLNYIDKNKVGMVVYDEESGKDTLTQLIRSKELRLSLGHKGFNISRIEFNQEKTNEILKNVVLKNLEDNL